MQNVDFTGITTIIFDVDGVLVDSEKLSCGALREVLKEECGVETGHDFSPVLGTSNSYAVKYYLDQNKIDYNEEMIEDIVINKAQRYQDLAEKNLQSFEGCAEFIQKAIIKGLKVTVASSGSTEKIKFSLAKVSLLQYFEEISSAEEVENGKPAPDLFLLAADKIGSKPSECVVVEDSIMGVKAAIAGGMKVLGFEGSFGAAELSTEGAYPFRSYKELNDRFLKQ